MDNIIKNYEEVLEKPPSTRLYLKFLKHKWKAKRNYKKNNKQELNKNKEMHNHPPAGIEIMSFAVIVDDVVVDVMNVQKEFGEILQKEPKFVFVQEGSHRPHIGWIYKDDAFFSIEDLSAGAQLTRRG